MGDTRGFRTHEGILADVLVTAWILSIGMAVVAAADHKECAQWIQRRRGGVELVNELQEAIEGAVGTEPRPAVVRFAQLMECKLRARDYKGGWENCTLQYLVDGMMEEVLELIGAMDATPTDDGPTNLYAVIEEAVDVANYCMMLADVAQAEIRREEG